MTAARCSTRSTYPPIRIGGRGFCRGFGKHHPAGSGDASTRCPSPCPRSRSGSRMSRFSSTWSFRADRTARPPRRTRAYTSPTPCPISRPEQDDPRSRAAWRARRDCGTGRTRMPGAELDRVVRAAMAVRSVTTPTTGSSDRRRAGCDPRPTTNQCELLHPDAVRRAPSHRHPRKRREVARRNTERARQARHGIRSPCENRASVSRQAV